MYRLVTPEDLKARLEAPERPVVIDLRDEAAFQAGHLPGAVLVPAGVSVQRWIPQRFATTVDLVLYDAGGESDKAAHEASHLSHLWYHGLHVLEGGFAAWRDAGLTVEQSAAVDPLGVGRRIATKAPPPGVVPEEFAPKE